MFGEVWEMNEDGKLLTPLVLFVRRIIRWITSGIVCIIRYCLTADPCLGSQALMPKYIRLRDIRLASMGVLMVRDVLSLPLQVCSGIRARRSFLEQENTVRIDIQEKEGTGGSKTYIVMRVSSRRKVSRRYPLQ